MKLVHTAVAKESPWAVHGGLPSALIRDGLGELWWKWHSISTKEADIPRCTIMALDPWLQ